MCPRKIRLHCWLFASITAMLKVAGGVRLPIIHQCKGPLAIGLMNICMSAWYPLIGIVANSSVSTYLSTWTVLNYGGVWKKVLNNCVEWPNRFITGRSAFIYCSNLWNWSRVLYIPAPISSFIHHYWSRTTGQFTPCILTSSAKN